MTRHKVENVPEKWLQRSDRFLRERTSMFLRVPRVDSGVISVLGREENQEEG